MLVTRILTKRIYEGIVPEDGYCVLVDRIWPRGISKEKLGEAIWFKNIAPSTELRKEFKHDPARWNEFKKRYFVDLDSQPELVIEFLNLIKLKEVVTLLYSARDTVHNQANALKEYLES
ncbi:DUF488 family protein [Opitutia bacterium ISCC 51]|nr:DUF488 family protein [Opitutae bacterium ISCC 51]QXD29948.1 DUF488 family protein [Opitutae bacterium ISCC 52]